MLIEKNVAADCLHRVKIVGMRMTKKVLENESPLVSIGMPVYNEAAFIKESLASLLAQDYQNLEIIISDNGSTDETFSICREYARLDSRVSYYRFDNNVGASKNFISVLERASGKYFMWAAGHDLWSDNLIPEAVQVLESHPDAALAFASAVWIDANGDVFGRESGWTDTRGMDPIARFFTILWGNMHPVLAVIRRSYLCEIPRIHSCAGSDLIILSELAIKGDFVHAAKATWSRREFRGLESHKEKIKRYKNKEYKLITSSIDKLFPLLRLPLELMRVVIRSDLKWLEKLIVLAALFPAFVARYVSGNK